MKLSLLVLVLLAVAVPAGAVGFDRGNDPSNFLPGLIPVAGLGAICKNTPDNPTGADDGWCYEYSLTGTIPAGAWLRLQLRHAYASLLGGTPVARAAE